MLVCKYNVKLKPLATNTVNGKQTVTMSTTSTTNYNTNFKAFLK